MTDFEFWSTVIALLGLGAIFVQLRSNHRAIIKDHDRRRMQATLEYMNAVWPKWTVSRRSIQDKLGTGAITDEQSKAIWEDKENLGMRNLLRDVLNPLEHLSVGIAAGVFDEDIFYQMSATSFIKAYEVLRRYITFVQSSQQSAYANFVVLAKRFKTRRSEAPQQPILVNKRRAPFFGWIRALLFRKI